MSRTMMTTLGNQYCTDCDLYPKKLSTNNRVCMRAISPSGHLINVTMLKSGRAYHTFNQRGGGKSTYIPGFLEHDGEKLYFIPNKQQHVMLLWNQDRERVPSMHMPEEVHVNFVETETQAVA